MTISELIGELRSAENHVGKNDRPIAALFVSGRTIYKYLAGVDAWDKARDARRFPGGTPVIAHPPCRLWSKYLAGQARPEDARAEMKMGTWAVRAVRKWGGVLEQPAHSRLWQVMRLPLPGAPADRHGGWTMYVEQRWFGYPNRKRTWLYIVGVQKNQLPALPFQFDRRWLADMSRQQRSRTMPAFACWLCQAARAAHVESGR